MRKRIVIILILFLIVGIVYPARANEVYATEVQEEDENGFVIEDGVLTSYTGAGGDIVIPDGVTSIGDSAFYYCSSLTSIELPSSVASIGDSAFSYCISLTSIELPSSVTSIGYSAFYDCSNLTEIEIPNSVMSIEDQAFSGCSSLRKIEIPNSVMSIGKQTFSGCSSLTEIEIPDSVTSMGSSVFSGCSSLTSIEIPDGIESIDGMFFGCSSLENVKIPDSVSYIGSSAFSNCSSLTSIELPSSVKSIWDYAFSGCSSLMEIEISSVMGIGRSAFSGCISLTEIEIPNGVTSIGASAFSDCISLTEIEIPDSVTSIGESAFSGCEQLENIIMPSNLSSLTTFSIGEKAFLGCSSLVDIKLPKGTSEISNAAFWGCSDLKNIAIPDGTINIGTNAFRNCSSLKKIGIPDSVTSIGAYAFDGCNEELCIYGNEGTYAQTYATENLINYMVRKNQTITASDFTKTIGDEPFSLGAVTNGDGILTYKSNDEEVVTVSENGIATIHGMGKATITITACGTAEWKEEQKNIDILVCSEQGFCIGSGFYDYDGFPQETEGALYAYRGEAEKVTIPDNVYVIEAGAFSGCDTVTSINIHKDVKFISRTAFDNCSNLKAITIDGKDGDYDYGADDNGYNYYSFDGVLYSWATCIRCPEGKEGTVKIPTIADVDLSIGAKAFLNCKKLTNVQWFSSRHKLYSAADAFEGCSDDFYIECYKGSGVETYAIENGIKYVTRKKSQQLYVGVSAISVTIGAQPYILDIDLEQGDGELTVLSSDETVVTVSETGELTFVGVGTAEITITASETEKYFGTQETITVTVNNKQNEDSQPDVDSTPDVDPSPGEDQKTDNDKLPDKVDKPAVEQTPSAGDASEEEEEQEADKKEQTITAKNLKKTYGAKAFSLGAKTDGDGTLTYSVENKKIAQIDKNGKVKIKGCGVTDIVISASETEEYDEATEIITLTVTPKKATLTSVKSTKAKTITVKWKKDTKASGYIIEYSTDKKFKKNVKKAIISKNETTSKKIPKLKAGKKYYVRVCAYTVSEGEKIKGAYSKTKVVKVKK